jgi:xanthine dehydrogenase YagR molybdenum-binding subunit
VSRPWSRRGFLQAALGTTALVARAGPAAAEDAPLRIEADGLVRVDTTINGVPHQLAVDGEETALSLLRDRLGLTGSKEGCGHGACGACTALLDGRTVNTCLLPACALDGAALQTVEGLPAALHPFQRALLAEDGLQCGYCTPGFAVEGAHFVDRWRAAHGDREPTREQVAAALSGHLCRCGAYDNIFRAAQGACAGRFDQPLSAPPVRVDAPEKVTGRARFTVDVRVEGQLAGIVLRSPHAHARLLRLDGGPALALPGVRAFLPLELPGGVARYAGQAVAALAAVDRATARRALRLVVADWEVLPAAATMEQARRPGAPEVYPDARGSAHNVSEGPVLPARWSGNVRGPTRSSVGMRQRAARRRLGAAPPGGLLLAQKTRTQTLIHTALEPHAAVASWRDDGLEVWLSTQAVHDMAHDLAERFDLAPERVRVHADYVGGGFGAKAVLTREAVVAVALSRAAGAPVRVAWERSEEMLVGGQRPGIETDLRVATDAEGGLHAMDVEAFGDGGAAVGNLTGLFYRVLYPARTKEITEFDVLTHTPPGAPMRGPGGPPAFFALEQAVDALALLRGEDPLALRRRWDTIPPRQRLFDQAAALPVWRDRGPVGADRGRFRRGVGLASAAWPCFVQPSSRVRLDASADGRLTISSASQDIGNGVRSMLAHEGARLLGLPLEAVTVRLGDSADVPGATAGGSRMTASVIPPLLDAMADLHEELVEVARARLGIRGTASPEGIVHAGGLLPWTDALRATAGLSAIGRRRRDQGGYFLPFPVAGLNASKYLTGTVQIAEVEVDTRLGRTVVRRVHVGLACGRVVVPRLAVAQAQGAVIQGIGYALYEERRVDPRTAVQLSVGLEDYRLPGIGDTPEIAVWFDEEGFEDVPGQSVGMSELATLPVAAAIANAVHHATGWRPLTLPLRADRVLAGVSA